jgi:aspartate aminotransferase
MTTVPASGIRRVFELAAQLDGVDMLVVGEPDVPVARHIADAARRAWADDRTDYTPNGGIPALREALVAKLARENRRARGPRAGLGHRRRDAGPAPDDGAPAGGG